MSTHGAVCAKEEFEALMFHLGAKSVESAAEAYELLDLEETANLELENLAPTLTELTKLYGYRYEEPKLYEGSMRLIVTSPMKFIKHYAWLLKQMDKDPFSVSYIF